jgi:translation elongation factor EF-1beta
MAAYNKNTFDKTYKDLRDKRLMTFDQDKISRVELTAKKGPIEFGRIAQNEWQILKPKPLRADGFQVEELVRKLKDANMDTTVSDDDAKKAAAAFGTAPMVAVAKVTDASGTQTLEVHKSKDDYYARSSVVEGVYKVNKDLGDGLDKSADDFRNKKIFDFGFSDPNRIEFKDGAQSVVASKTGEKWMSAAGKELDSTSVQAFIDKVRDLSASKFPESGFGMPAIELTVISNDGKRTEKVQIAPASTATFLARREGEPALYELEANTVQDLRKTGADVKEAPPPAAPAKKK